MNDLLKIVFNKNIDTQFSTLSNNTVVFKRTVFNSNVISLELLSY